jgi:hypothetical protein
MTEAEIEAAARRLCAWHYAASAPMLQIPPHQDRWPMFKSQAEAVLAAAEAVRKSDLVPGLERALVAFNEVFRANRDKWQQAVEKPMRLGWFVGQVMKKTGGSIELPVVEAVVSAAASVALNKEGG